MWGRRHHGRSVSVGGVGVLVVPGTGMLGCLHRLGAERHPLRHQDGGLEEAAQERSQRPCHLGGWIDDAVPLGCGFCNRWDPPPLPRRWHSGKLPAAFAAGPPHRGPHATLGNAPRHSRL